MQEKSKEYDVGVIVGRFQVAELHDSHIELIQYVCSKHKKVIIILGVSAVPGTQHNPLDFEHRFNLLRSRLPTNVTILPLRDCANDNTWSDNLDKIIQFGLLPSQTICLYGSRDSFIKHYSGKYPTVELIGGDDRWSGTLSRSMIKNSAIDSFDFRAGAIWQTFNRYPHVIHTVDVAVCQHGDNTNVLLCKKPGDKLFRFIGGFADVSSFKLEHDVIREVREESGLIIINPTYISNHKIDDWRYRQDIDKIHTTFFYAKYDGNTKPLANDDIIYCAFISFKDLTINHFVPEHHCLFNDLSAFLLERGLV